MRGPVLKMHSRLESEHLAEANGEHLVFRGKTGPRLYTPLTYTGLVTGLALNLSGSARLAGVADPSTSGCVGLLQRVVHGGCMSQGGYSSQGRFLPAE